MKFIFIALFLFTISGFSQSTSSLEDQLRLRYSSEYIEYVKTQKTELYNFYLSELKSSYEFIELRSDLKYNDLIGYDFINQQEKNIEFISNEKFSLYNYKFIRYKNKDIAYRIPGTNQGILIYSKEKFTSKL